MEIQIQGGSQSSSVATQLRDSPAVVAPQVAAPSVPANVVRPADSAVSQEQVKNAVAKVNEVVQNMTNGSNLEFTVDKETNINVIKVVDKETNETIRQFPSEEILAIAKALDKLQGLIIQQKA